MPTSNQATASATICLLPDKRSESTLPAIVQASNLMENPNLQAPNELIEGVMHRGTKVLFAAASKVGKTWLLLLLAACIANGTPFLGWPTESTRVLYINLEILSVFLKDRLKIVQEGLGLPHLDNLDVWNLRGHITDFDRLFEDLTTAVQDNRYGLIIIDPIYKVMVGRSENSASGIGVLCHRIEKLAERSGAAVIYAHHFTKGNAAEKKSIDRMSGSGVFARDADTIITLSEHAEEDCYVLDTNLRNLPPQPPFVVQWNFPVFIERRDLDPADLNRRAEQEEDELEPIVALLDERPLSSGEWQLAAEAQGYSRATFFRMKKKLDSEKRVTFCRKQKSWGRAGNVIGATADQGRDTAQSPDTLETSATLETLRGQIHSAEHGVASDQNGCRIPENSPRNPTP